ncbi:hypothetical protein [Sulfuriroseicoccus oceanibius]|uniref:Uncharacterized protein n=1 Tax=Sulfuriroseicoccus oceanibius TaxID=2707525 RepID=A0A6B3L9D1_9BACT|nr:hypothetical protein [Sulfuriroseicoccus oceanibius]QQL44238.1 hypothetical protein G3M56_010065 [Sulfuriroseicoccus oceanibius]
MKQSLDTIAERLCAAYGLEQGTIAKSTIHRWKQRQYPITQPAALLIILGNLQRQPEWFEQAKRHLHATAAEAGSPTTPPQDIADAINAQLEKLHAEMSDATDYATARTLKTKTSAAYDLLRLSRAMGELVSVEKAHDAGFRMGTMVKAMLNRMVDTLPPMLAGLDEVGIVKVLRPYLDQTLREFHEATARELEALKDEAEIEGERGAK